MSTERREPFSSFRSPTVVLAVDNIDTDQIIPARFLKSVTRDGMGQRLFNDWRYRQDGTPDPAFILNRPEASRAQVLVAGDNFGCGSSREHATWALRQFGFRAVVSTSFGDIFRNNALKNQLLPIVVPAAAHAKLLQHPGAEVAIDLAAQSLTVNGERFEFPIDGFSKRCLLEGVDELGYILQRDDAIANYEREHPATIDTTA